MNPMCGFSPARIGAMVIRYAYLLRRSWPRMLELIYWPTVQMLLWGLISQFFVQHSTWVAQAAGVLLAAVMLWDVLFRAHLGVSLAFFEEMYARNMGHLFVSPLRVSEHIAALLGISILRTLIGLSAAAGLAYLLYDYSLLELGLPLIAFFSQLMIMGWAIGLGVMSLVLRYGLGAESLAWVLVFALAPISAVYYPVSIFPEWLQPVSLAIPASHVFEGMRTVLFEKVFDWHAFRSAVLLNLVWISAAISLYYHAFYQARQRGSLLNAGD